MQPAAETAIQRCLLHQSATTDPAGEAMRVATAYLVLREQLRSFEVGHPIGSHLATLLERHARLLDLAVEAVKPVDPTRAEAGPRPPDGLGPVAGQLVSVRDLLRRTVQIDDRTVADLPVRGRL
jgi:hypothetical protein